MSKKSNTKPTLSSQAVPVPPKKPLTAFFKWSGDNREIFKKKNPELIQKELMSLLGEEWRKISEKDKKKYTDSFEKDKKKYDDEMRAYVEKYGPVKQKKKEMDAGEKKGKKTKKEKASVKK